MKRIVVRTGIVASVVACTLFTAGYFPHFLVGSELAEARNLTKQWWLWYLPPEKLEVGADGARWLIQVKRDGKYSYIVRWSSNGGVIRKTGEKMMQLSGFAPVQIS